MAKIIKTNELPKKYNDFIDERQKSSVVNKRDKLISMDQLPKKMQEDIQHRQDFLRSKRTRLTLEEHNKKKEQNLPLTQDEEEWLLNVNTEQWDNDPRFNFSDERRQEIVQDIISKQKPQPY